MIENREALANLLVSENVLEMHEGKSGIWRGDEFISFYDLLEKLND
jgi:hypothetical protein